MPDPRTLPHSTEAERAVLACVLLRPELIRELADQLRAEHFYAERHQLIWRAMAEIWVEHGEGSAEKPGPGIDLRTLQAHLEERGKFEQIGGLAYLADLDTDLPDLGGWERYAGIVRERYARRRLLQGLAEVTAKSLDAGARIEDSLAEVSALQVELEDAIGARGELRPIADSVASDELDWNREPRTLAGLATGFPDLDKLTFGACPGDLWILAGRPGMGKTSIGLQIVHAFAAAGARVAVISLEMTDWQLTRRMVSQVARVPLWALRSFRLSDRWKEAAWAASAELNRLPIWIDAAAALTVGEICSRIRRQAALEGVDAVVIDYLGRVRLRHASGASDVARALGEVSSSLAALGKDLRVPVIALSQVNREPAKGGAPPQLAHLSESDKLAQDADLVAFLHRPAVYDGTAGQGQVEEAELHVAKNREGATGKIPMTWEPQMLRYACRDDRYPPEVTH